MNVSSSVKHFLCTALYLRTHTPCLLFFFEFEIKCAKHQSPHRRPTLLMPVARRELCCFASPPGIGRPLRDGGFDRRPPACPRAAVKYSCASGRPPRHNRSRKRGARAADSPATEGRQLLGTLLVRATYAPVSESLCSCTIVSRTAGTSRCAPIRGCMCAEGEHSFRMLLLLNASPPEAGDQERRSAMFRLYEH